MIISIIMYSANLRCSSINFGVTQITCCPFQYFTKFRLWDKMVSNSDYCPAITCKVEMMSPWVILVMVLRSLMLRVPRKSLRISRRTQDQ